MSKLLYAVPALALAVFAMVGAGIAGQANAQDGALVVIAGDGEPGYAVNQFMPNEVTIEVGAPSPGSSPGTSPTP